MKKLLQRLFTALAALSIIFTSLGAVSTVFAQENAPGANDTYDIVLTKVKMKDLNGWPKQEGNDGTKYTGQKLDSLTNYFGAEATTLDGVWFEVHKYDEAKADHIGELVAGKEGATANGGQITFKDLPAGKYMIVERKDKSTLASQEQLANSATVPMEVNLPVFKATGGWYTKGNDALHVYPKNTVDKPSIDKVVNENDKHDSADLGQTKTFKITSKMPNGIADYKVLNFEDKFSNGLSYKGNLKVMKNGQVVAAGNDTYTATEPAVNTKGANIKVSFKEAYIKTLTPNDTITITYDAVVNEDAVMGAENPNEAKVQYGTNPNVVKEEKPGENPELHVGGKRFIKQDKSTATALQDAEFVVKNSENKYMKKDNNVVTWVADKNQATVLKSKNDGTFEVTGLAFGNKGKKPSEADTTTYYLEETKAPQGYALLQQPIEFKVGYNTYYEDPTAVNKKSSSPQVVNNNKVTIPQTGGIGSVVVIVAGILIVGLGLFAKRRATEKD